MTPSSHNTRVNGKKKRKTVKDYVEEDDTKWLIVLREFDWNGLEYTKKETRTFFFKNGSISRKDYKLDDGPTTEIEF